MAGSHIKHIFLILMENHNWSDIAGNAAANYINSKLLPMSSYCTNYFDNPQARHPSEPNYIWLEAATDTFSDDNDTWVCDCDPSKGNSTASTQHLASLLTAAGKTWREYAEDYTANDCPVNSGAEGSNYAAKHVPFVFFQDISGNPPSSATTGACTANIKPFSQLATDLQNGTVADYNFITPNLCDDMHTDCTNTGTQDADEIAQGDNWLQTNIPLIMNSSVYQDSAIFITWDESEGGEFPIGMIVLSPFAKGNGTTSTVKYYHSSMVRTVEEVFGLTPLIADAANQPPLSDLFKSGMYP